MVTIILEFDYGFGPIMGSHRDIVHHRDLTRIPAIDNDSRIQELNDTLQNMYSGCYEFDVDDKPCVFRKENADPAVMLDYLRQLKERLDEINDGSFVVEDHATWELLHWNED